MKDVCEHCCPFLFPHLPEIATVTLKTTANYNYLCTCDLYSPVHNVLDGCIYIRWGSGRGLGPGIPEFFWALSASSIWGPKNLGIPGPNPFQLPQVMYMHL
jgi:hypothetical protein